MLIKNRVLNLSYTKTVQCKKKTLIVMHSVNTQESVCGSVYELCLAPKMGCMAYE